MQLIDEGLDPHLTVRRAPGTLELEARIRLDRLCPLYSEAKLVVALSAVLEDSKGVLSYWALAHAPGKPDFHHPAAFALDLP